MGKISYEELANRLDELKLFNKAPELDLDLYDGLENGELDEDTEIYQWYLISPSDADYIKRNTNELIFYSEVLDEYLLGITHFGTPWEDVYLEFSDKEEATK